MEAIPTLQKCKEMVASKKIINAWSNWQHKIYFQVSTSSNIGQEQLEMPQ